MKKEQKDEMINKIKQFFYDERDEEIGDLAAFHFLEFAEKELSPHFYNEGVNDAKVMVEQKLMNLEEDLASLEKILYYRK